MTAPKDTRPIARAVPYPNDPSLRRIIVLPPKGGTDEPLLIQLADENAALRAEVEALRHDIERHVRIAAELATENAALREKLQNANPS